jgi:hypothetical protein
MNEDFERRFESKMEFIVTQQAQFTVDIQRLGEKIEQLGERQGRTESLVARLATVTLNRFERLEETVATLADSQVKFQDSVAEKMRELVEAQMHTDRRLSALIDIVRDEREGKS